MGDIMNNLSVSELRLRGMIQEEIFRFLKMLQKKNKKCKKDLTKEILNTLIEIKILLKKPKAKKPNILGNL